MVSSYGLRRGYQGRQWASKGRELNVGDEKGREERGDQPYAYRNPLRPIKTVETMRVVKNKSLQFTPHTLRKL